MTLPPMPPRPERPDNSSASPGVTPEASAVAPSQQGNRSDNTPSTNSSAYSSEQGYATYAQNSPVREEPSHSSKKPLIIGGAVGAGVLLLAGGAFAYNALAPAPGGPEEAIPASAIMFAKVDLDPSADQKMAFMQLQDKFPELKTENSDGEGSFREIASSAFFGDLDYASEVEPWIGDRFAIGALANDSDPSSAYMVAVYSVKDAGEAKDAAAKISDPSFIYEDKYLVLADTEESLEAWKADIKADGMLSENDEYQDDMKQLDGDTIASLWVDLDKAGQLGQEAALQTGLSEAEMLTQELTGSVVGGIHLEKDAIQAQMISVGAGGTVENLELAEGNVDEINNLPANAIGALAMANLDQTLTSVWAQYEGEIDAYTRDSISSLGINLPDDFTKLVGTQTAVGVYSLSGDEGVPALSARMKGADKSLLEGILTDAGLSQIVTLSDEDDNVLMSTGGVTEGKLGDSDKFKDVVLNRDDALAIAFLDIDAVLAEEGGTDTGKSYGYAGASVSYDQKKDIGDVTIRWVFNK